MLSFKEFMEKVKSEIHLLCGDGYQIIIEPVPRNNGTEQMGIDIRKGQGEEMAHLCLDSYYEQYLDGMPVDEAVKDIWDIFNSFEQRKVPEGLLDDFEKVKNKVVFSLVNYEMKREWLESMPYVPYLDLAITFYVLMDRTENGERTAVVTNKELTAWGATKEELLLLAKQNSPRLYMAEVNSLNDVMKSFIKDTKSEAFFDEFIRGEEFPLYVLSNRNGVKGAAVILYDGLLKEIAKSLENDLLILPSSVHEVLVMAYDKEMDFLSLRDMVEHINKVEVPVCDVLSNQIYRYSRKKDQVSLIIVDVES